MFFFWPCSSEGSERLTLCKHGALSHTVEQEGDSFSSFSLHTSRQHCTFLTSTGDLLTSFEYSFTAAGSLESCRSKSRADGKLQKRSPAPAQLYPESLGRLQHGETQGQQCAHGPCSHPLWKRGLSPVPATHQNGKPLSSKRVDTPLCAAHGRLYEESESQSRRQSKDIPSRFS